MKILVIEDEKLLADSLKTMLEAKGFEVETAYGTLIRIGLEVNFSLLFIMWMKPFGIPSLS